MKIAGPVWLESKYEGEAKTQEKKRNTDLVKGRVRI